MSKINGTHCFIKQFYIINSLICESVYEMFITYNENNRLHNDNRVVGLY